jgi:hypothetical protein
LVPGGAGTGAAYRIIHGRTIGQVHYDVPVCYRIIINAADDAVFRDIDPVKFDSVVVRGAVG